MPTSRNMNSPRHLRVAGCFPLSSKSIRRSAQNDERQQGQESHLSTMTRPLHDRLQLHGTSPSSIPVPSPRIDAFLVNMKVHALRVESSEIMFLKPFSLAWIFLLGPFAQEQTA